MLVEFRTANHRSIKEEQALTLAAGRVGSPDDPRPRAVEGSSGPLLPVAAIYGANASGKSNLLMALAYMRDAVSESHRRWAPEGGVPRDPFAWGDLATPSLFEIVFVVDGTRYEYGFSTDGHAFLEEWLHAWPLGHKQMWFERDRQEMRFGEKLRGENRVVAEVTRPNALFLSASAQLQHEQLRPVYRWLTRIQVESLPGSLPRSRAASWTQLGLASSEGEQTTLFPPMEEGVRESRFAALLELLRAADVGIVDAKLVEEPDPYQQRTSLQRAVRRRVYLRHEASESGWLPLEEESHGTQTIFRLAAPLLEVIGRGGVLVVDELERSLHPLLALQIVRQFNDPKLNPKNAQLIFTTHDTNLLGTVVGEPALRRDQVWLTEKNKLGATELYPLTDYQPRKEENLERGYLQGRYGAIPFLASLVPSGSAE
jgi:predicted ATPase